MIDTKMNPLKCYMYVTTEGLAEKFPVGGVHSMGPTSDMVVRGVYTMSTS